MKKFLFSILTLMSIPTFAQDFPKNEVKLNILNTIAIASVEVGYERFFAPNQSADAELFINDRFAYFRDKGDTKFSATSIKIGYNYYFDLEGLSGPYMSPFIKQRIGNYKEKIKKEEQEIWEETSLNSFILGLGFGYMWNYNDTFILAPYLNISRNFGKGINESNKFWAVEPNAGIRIGFRF